MNSVIFANKIKIYPVHCKGKTWNIAIERPGAEPVIGKGILKNQVEIQTAWKKAIKYEYNRLTKGLAGK